MSEAADRLPPQAEHAGVIIPWTDEDGSPSDWRLQETAGLVEALQCDLAFVEALRLRKVRPSHLLPSGVVDMLRDRLSEAQCTLFVVDGALSPAQQRNLERDLQVKVIDRTGLILEIFGLRARTKEGAIQVELARLSYERSRLVRTWTHLERQRGGAGFLSGPGESQLEADRRMLDRRLRQLREELDDVRRTRGVQRAARVRGERPLVALVGYTNAGKSTLFNKLTGADVLAKDMPFATLDPTVRSIKLPVSGRVSFIDTVGFITDLPTHLIESFKATLEEVVTADLLLHVRDRSNEAESEHKRDVLTILGQIEGASNAALPPIVEVWNKADILSIDQKAAFEIAARADEDAFLVSARTGEGVQELLEAIDSHLARNSKTIRLGLSPADGRARAWLYEHALVMEEDNLDDGGVEMLARISDVRFRQLADEFPDIIQTID